MKPNNKPLTAQDEYRKDYNMIEPDKDIVLHCSDYMGEYDVLGRFIKYKQKPFKARFCTFDNVTNKYETNSKEWSQREGWKYK